MEIHFVSLEFTPKNLMGVSQSRQWFSKVVDQTCAPPRMQRVQVAQYTT